MLYYPSFYKTKNPGGDARMNYIRFAMLVATAKLRFFFEKIKYFEGKLRFFVSSFEYSVFFLLFATSSICEGALF